MTAWPLVPLGDVLSQRKEFIQIDDALRYKRCRVQLHAQGIVLRDEVSGIEIKTRSQQVCREDEFLVAEIDAKVGGFGIVPATLDGAIVSSHYFLFRVNPSLLDVRYLRYYVKTAAFRDQVTAQGSTNYAAIRPSDVLSYTMPLPPIKDQRRIVQRIELLTRKVQTVQKLQLEITTQLDSLIRSVTSDLFVTASKRFGVVKLSSVIADSGYGTSVKCSLEREDGSVPVLRIPNVAAGAISLSDLKFGVLSERELDGVSLQGGDVLVVRTNGSLSLVGRCAVVEELSEPTAFASYLIRLRCDKRQVLPGFLQSALNYLRESRWLIEFARTTAGQYNVSLGRLHEAEIPLPPLEEQERIVRRLRSVVTQMRPCYSMRYQLEKESNAVTASILNRAFSGQL